MAIAQQQKWDPIEDLPVSADLRSLDIDMAAAPASPVHAMHQLLSTNFESDRHGVLASPSMATKFSIVFYAGLAAWIALAIPVFVIARIW